jgi:putative ABC transport system permease protein
VVVLAHHFWSGHFNADPDVVGRTAMLNGRGYTIVGVVTPDVELGTLAAIDLWVPLDLAAATDRESRSLTAQGLLRPGATLDAASAELATIADRLARAYPAVNTGWRLFGVTLRASTVGTTTWVLIGLLGVVVALVLVVACANVATVMLARASARRREIAVRLALGATRARLVRQLVSENVIIGLASGAIGVLLAHQGLVGFKMLSPEPFWQRLAVNGNLLAFGFALSIATPLLFGVLPALQSSRPDLNEDLKEGGRDAASSVRGNRSRSVLVVAQVAFALAVLIVCGLIVRTVIGLEHVPLGMNPDNMLTTRIRLDPPRYEDDGARLRAVESILDRLAAVPGVTAASAMRSFPVVDGEGRRQFAIAGRPVVPVGSSPWAAEAATYGDYGKTIGLPLLEGRTWNAGDRASGWTVAIVNREAVRRYWPSRSPIGDRITMLDSAGRPTGRPIDIIGVVDNVIGGDLAEPPPPRVYRPLPATAALDSVGFAVRAAGDPAALATSIRAALRAEDRDLAVSDVQVAREQLDIAQRTLTLVIALFSSFAGIGLLVAVTGVYGVTAFSVGQRRHEIGVRMALGAGGADVMRLIAGRSFRLIAAGTILGVLVGWGIGLTMRNILFGVGAADPITYAAVVAIVGLSAAVATYIPARRAIAIDPMAVLKRE